MANKFRVQDGIVLPYGGIIEDTVNTTVITPPTALAGQSLVIRPTAGNFYITTDHPDGFVLGESITVTVTSSGGADYGTVEYTITDATSEQLGTATTGTLTFNEESAKTLTWTVPAQSDMTAFTFTITGGTGFGQQGGVNTGAAITITLDGTIIEGGHIHLVSGDPTTVDIYLGDDDQYVKIEKDGGAVVIGTDANTNHWKFSNDGRLYLPGGEPSIYSSDNSEITVSTPGNIELNNTGGTWTFDDNGNLKLPSGGDILDSTGTSVLGGTSLAPELTKSGGNLVASTTLEFQGVMYGAIFDIDSNGDFDVWIQTVTGGDDGMSYAIGSNDDGYNFVYAFNASGTVSWKVGLDSILGHDNTAYGIKYKSGYLYLTCQYYNNSVGNGENQLSVLKLDATDGTVDTSWVLTNSSTVSYRPRDITVNSSGDPIVVGQSYGETQTFTGLTPQTGSGSKVLVVNANELNNAAQTNPWGSYYVHTDPNDPNAWYQTSRINWFMNLPTVVLTGTGDGTLTVNVRYMYSNGTWLYDYVEINNPGTGYNDPDQVKVLGSSIGGIDEVDDIIMSRNSWYMNVLSVGGTSGNLCPSVVSNKIRLIMDQTVDFSTGTWDVRIGLDSQAVVWTPNWQHSYGSVDGQSFRSVSVDSSDNIYLLGEFQYYDGSTWHNVLAMKLNSSGVQQWVKYIEDDTGSQDPGSIFTDSSGNCFIISQNDNGYTLVTKLDSSGDLVWQVKQDDNNNWNNYAVGGLDSNGDIIVMGSWYNGNSEVTNIHKLSGTDGSLVWSRDFSNQQDYDMNEYYDEDGQAGHVVGDNFYYGGYCYDSNNDRDVGFGFRLPTDGTGTGTYGRYVYSNNTNTEYTENTSNAVVTNHTYDPNDSVSMTYVETSASTTADNVGTTTTNHWFIGTGGGLTGVDSITFSDGTVLTTAGSGGGGSGGWTPGNNIVQTVDTDLRIVVKDPNENSYRIDLAAEDDNGTVKSRIDINYDRVQIETNTGQKQWRFESNGEFRIPGNINTYDNDINIVAMNAGGAGNITIKTVSNSNDTHFSSVDLNQNGVNITVDMDNTPGGKSFEFRDSGVLVLPAGGDIQDASAVSVLGKEPKFTLQYQNFNAVSGTRYCIDAVGSAVTAMLPTTPIIGDAIFFVDAYGSFATNNLTIDGNGKTIVGFPTFILSTDNQNVGVFYNGTEWRTY